MEAPQSFPYVVIFPIVLWLLVTSVLSLLSGWYFLMSRYPDQYDAPYLSLKRQSGAMGFGVAMRGILNIEVCSSGLRLSMLRVFGPFNRSFFVSWSEIEVTRKNYFGLFTQVKLRFGSTGKLTISDTIANRLWRAVPACWPEHGQPPIQTSGFLLLRFGLLWFFMTLIGSTFFIVVPRMSAPEAARPPMLVAILFPAIVFGLNYLVEFWLAVKRSAKT